MLDLQNDHNKLTTWAIYRFDTQRMRNIFLVSEIHFDNTDPVTNFD